MFFFFSINILGSSTSPYDAVYITFRQINDVFSPAAKLNLLHVTFAKANELIKEASAGKAKALSMDTLFPLFMSIIVRSGIQNLGSEIQFLEDFLDMESLSGESKILVTTLKAAYVQIIKDYELEYIL
jgi:hypothetical protein